MNKIAGVIPSRWGSTRFPGKSLALISGKPMIQWVLDAISEAEKVDNVIIIGLSKDSKLICKKHLFFVPNQMN